MKGVENNPIVRQEQGFDVYQLGNEDVEIAVVPELGAKIISLKNLKTGREWLWHPPGPLKLFANRLGDDFATSPLAGMDECLPTIAPCAWRGRELPDHGEAWSAAWTVDSQAWDCGILKTSCKLALSPLEFERTILLLDNGIRMVYRLTNQGPATEQFLWALHPLLQLEAGDQLELPTSTRALLNGNEWVDSIDTAVPDGNCAKVFAAPLDKGISAIHNKRTGERLEFEWNVVENHALGLWLTRGGWHGMDHFAMEPTNGDSDFLTVAARRERCRALAPFASATWQIQIRIGS
ncbi:hypothetical protein [Pedosphaera parvula]|uniref:Aldose 1-epimerase n=1 Tax=Pedosphaera parvula (strain Ellin514) TaxID=320771 RepID=B9XJ48_PEDPL|nr:hypothetical protein [Pedosphaera parvula]EEF60086.1 hypothetical protein Cflav_PD3145 [Pedosphaera parvula Ellin514]